MTTPTCSTCGCKVKQEMIQVGKWGEGSREWIEFCPLHAAAEEMLEALKQMRLFIGYEPTSPIVKQFDDLITRAQKGAQ